MSKFKEIIQGSHPVLVDFHAEWCGPCKMMAPILKQFKSEVGDAVKIIKVDVDKNQAAAAAYNVRGVPTLILFKDGEIIWRQSGVVSKDQLAAVVKQHA